MDGYVADKARIYHNVQRAAIYNVAEPHTERLVAEAEVIEGARAIGFTLGTPAISMLGIVDNLLTSLLTFKSLNARLTASSISFP